MSLLDALKGLLDTPGPPADDEPLRRLVAEHMPEAPDEEVRIVAAVAGLLACVAFADQHYADVEADKIREELGRIHGLPPAGVEAIASAFEKDIGRITGSGDHSWVRDLKKLADREQRVEILDVLLDLAAVDDEFTLSEANYLRRLAAALGLSQIEYTEAQARHREKLTLLDSPD